MTGRNQEREEERESIDWNKICVLRHSIYSNVFKNSYERIHSDRQHIHFKSDSDYLLFYYYQDTAVHRVLILQIRFRTLLSHSRRW